MPRSLEYKYLFAYLKINIYFIEIYLDKRHKQGNIENEIVENAFQYQCERFYGNYEISGIRKTIHTNLYIISFLFPDDIKHIIKKL